MLDGKTTFVWSLNVVILVFATAASGFFRKQDSGVGLSLELSATKDIFSEKPPRQNAEYTGTDRCVSDAGCKNGGECLTGEDGSNYCLCKNGTSGDTCEVVDDCVQYPMLCGLFNDTQCVYDLEKQKAKCNCSDDSKKFDSYLEKCRVPCSSSQECPDTVLCRREKGDDFRFCRCRLDSGGDRCTDLDVDQCQDRGLDCGNSTKVACVDGKNGPACSCHSSSEGYNYQAKDCLKCNCGESNLGCQWFPNGTKQCNCQGKFYQEDGRCKPCKCGVGSSGCKLINGTKKCDCWGHYVENNGYCKDRCVSDEDCQNGGVCLKDKDGSNYCKCKTGTSGDTCEVVDDCVRYPMLCGLFNDTQCVYDLEKLKAKCNCSDDSKEFDSYLEKCRVPCNTSEECHNTARCRREKGDDFRFCRCRLDSGGDRCTDPDVDQCRERGLDCGNSTKVACVDGKNGPVCSCHSSSEGYNYEIKDCLKCDCEGSNIGCQWFPNGTKECFCQKYFYQEDEKCKDCKCGVGANGCKLENGKKKCDCWGRYLDNDGVCEECNCGKNQDGCSFKNKKKHCFCKLGYLESNGTCKKNCNLWNVECQHGGLCVDSVCECLPGTIGDVCEVIKGCETSYDVSYKCGTRFVRCDFNETSHQTYCQCTKEGDIFDEINKECKPCDCGRNGSCYFVQGARTCECKKGYSEKPSTFYESSKCEPCDCGEGSIACSFPDSEVKSCSCRKGYSQKIDKCEVCDCGKHGSCSFNILNEMQCSCDYGYLERKGLCTDCQCGLGAKCVFDEKNRKRCICREEYVYNGFKCENCGCFLDDFTRINCTYKHFKKMCLCPQGYQAEKNLCKDINECLNPSACPPNTTCKNTIGNYTCSCNTGYRPHNDTHDPKINGCIEINECVEKNACPFRDSSECVNTLGSHYCRCKNGYSSSFPTHAIEVRGCDKDQTGMKIGYFVLILVSIIAFSALLMIVANYKDLQNIAFCQKLNTNTRSS